MNSPAIKVFDLAKEMIDILSNMSKDELMELKLMYDITFKKLELVKIRERLKDSDVDE